MKILNPRSRDISQKLRQNKCTYTFRDLKAEIYNDTKKFGTGQFGKVGVLVNLIIQKLRNKHLTCLSFEIYHVIQYLGFSF